MAVSLASVRRPFVRPSVRPSVNILCLLYNLNTVRNTLMILHSHVEQVMPMCAVQNENSHLNSFFTYCPFDAFYAYWCPLCNLGTLGNIIMILHNYVEQIMTIFHVQE